MQLFLFTALARVHNFMIKSGWKFDLLGSLIVQSVLILLVLFLLCPIFLLLLENSLNTSFNSLLMYTFFIRNSFNLFPWNRIFHGKLNFFFVVNWISSKTFTASGNDWVEEPLPPEILIKFYIHLKVHCTLLQILILLRIDVHIQCMPSIVFGWPIAVTTPSIV